MTTAQIILIIFSYILAFFSGVVANDDDPSANKAFGLLFFLFFVSICGVYL